MPRAKQWAEDLASAKALSQARASRWGVRNVPFSPFSSSGWLNNSDDIQQIDRRTSSFNTCSWGNSHKHENSEDRQNEGRMSFRTKGGGEGPEIRQFTGRRRVLFR